MPRFEVITEETYLWIKDNDFERYHMPEKAVSLAFPKDAVHAICNDQADIVAKGLNIAWGHFIANPN
jgi:hypothetical protein